MTRKEMKEWQVLITEAEIDLKNETVDLFKEMIKDMTPEELALLHGYNISDYDSINEIDTKGIITFEGIKESFENMPQPILKEIIDFVSLNIWVK